MYHKSFIQQLHDHNTKETTHVLASTTGYVYNYEQDMLANYHSIYGCFYTFFYKVEDYLNGVRHRYPTGSLEDTPVPHEVLNKPNFTIGIHSDNSLLTNNLIKKRIHDPEEVQRILKEFIG